MKWNKCKCIKDTTIKDIVVGNNYKYYKKDLNVYGVIYNETDKTFEEAYGTAQWFIEYFKVIK